MGPWDDTFDADTGEPVQVEEAAVPAADVPALTPSQEIFQRKLAAFSVALKHADNLGSAARALGVPVSIDERHVNWAAAGLGAWLVWQAINKGR
jgi:hypothetical protein